MARKALVPGVLRELGYPTDLPPLPGLPDELIAPRASGEWAKAARHARQEGVRTLLDSKGAMWGVGVGADESGSKPAIVFLVDPGRKARRAVPGAVGTFPVMSMKVAPRLNFLQGPRRPFVRASGALTGSSVGNEENGDPLAGPGGTLSGIFRPLFGNGRRALTCAHVATGVGAQDLLQDPLARLPRLFASPSGKRLYFADATQIGQPRFELCRIDTPWPVLVWLPLGTFANTLSFLYLDAAAGDVRIRPAATSPIFFPPILPPDPPRKETVQGDGLGTARPFAPGEAMYGIGRTLGLRRGTGLLFGLTLALPIPLGIVNFILVFNLNLIRMPIAPGDSGYTAIIRAGDHPVGINGLGLGGSPANPVNDLTLGVPFTLVDLFTNVRM